MHRRLFWFSFVFLFFLMYLDECTNGDDYAVDCKQRVKILLKRILTKVITDRIFALTYQAQERHESDMLPQ